MQKRRIAFVVIAVAGVVGAAAVLAVARAAADGKPNPPHSTFSVAQARAFGDFPVYSAGQQAEGLPLVAVLRQTAGAANYVSFIYGDCVATGEMACAPPAEVQVWPACVRNMSLYDPELGPEFTQSDVRGAPAFVFEEGRRIELQTGASTVVVFGRDAQLTRGVAMRLEGVNNGVRAPDQLPAPAEGALEGRLNCR